MNTGIVQPHHMAVTTTTYRYSTFPEVEFGEATIPVNEELLTSIVQIQGKSGSEGSMQQFIWDFLEAQGLTPLGDKKGNIYCTKGEAEYYPTMVAHMDTVHTFQKEFSIHKSPNGKILYAFNEDKGEQAGIGGDDRCGIYVALQLLLRRDTMKVAFFVEEETGGQGSRASDITFFDDSSVVLQCDRKGHDDWVQTVSGTKVASDEFIALIGDLLKAHQYTVTQGGGFTDVGVLKQRGLKVCAANMSCAYYNPHSAHETIHLPALGNTLNLCAEVLDLVGATPQLHEHKVYVAPTRPHNQGGNSYGTSGYNARYEAERLDPFHRNFSPMAAGWVYITNIPGASYAQCYVKNLTSGRVGPFTWQEVVDLERKAATALKEVAEKSSKDIKDEKKKIKDWIQHDGSWEFNKKTKLWQKVLSAPGEEQLWIVGYALRLEDVIEADNKWQQDWGDWEEIVNDKLLWTPEEISRMVHTELRKKAEKQKNKGGLFTDEEQSATLPNDQLALPPATLPHKDVVAPGDTALRVAGSESTVLTVHRDVAEGCDCPKCGADCSDSYEPKHSTAYCATCNDWWNTEEAKDDATQGTWRRHWSDPLVNGQGSL